MAQKYGFDEKDRLIGVSDETIKKMEEKRKRQKNEKYYICHECGNLSTESKNLEDCEQGGIGLCECRYMIFEWSKKYNDIEPIYLREYPGWTDINKKWYYCLLGEKNTVLRLQLFNIIPRKELMK